MSLPTNDNSEQASANDIELLDSSTSDNSDDDVNHPNNDSSSSSSSDHGQDNIDRIEVSHNKRGRPRRKSFSKYFGNS